MAGFNTAVTGLKASGAIIDVAGNNIANSSTIGFKQSRVEFVDIYNKAIVGAGASNTPGSGVMINSITQDFSSGPLEYTNNSLDLAINGAGFFQLSTEEGMESYTRAGAFEINKDGFVVNKAGKYLQGYGLDSTGNQMPVGNLQVSQKESPSKATEFINMSFNIDTASDAANLSRVFDKTDPNSYTHSMTVGTFDSLGNENNVRFYFVEQRPTRDIFDFSTVSPSTGDKSIDYDPTHPNADANGIVYDPNNTGDIFRISGMELGSELKVVPVMDDAGVNVIGAKLDNTSGGKLSGADDRIDYNTVFFDFSTDSVYFEFKSEYSGYGKPFVDYQGEPVESSLQGVASERPATEIQEIQLDPTQFTSGLSGTERGVLTQVSVAGVTIEIPSYASVVDAGEIIESYEQKIINSNPNVESVQFKEDAGEYKIQVTWAAEAGDIDELLVVEEYNSQNVFFDRFPADGTVDVKVVQNGDKSFLGAYRTYSYLNDERLLDMGKPMDPGTDSIATSETGPIIIRFNSTTGLLEEVNGDRVSVNGDAPKITILGADPVNPDDMILDSDIDGLAGIQLDISNSSQFASASMMKSLEKDGRTKGDLAGISFNQEGRMVASFSNGEKLDIGIVAIANFENQNGLRASGDTEWIASTESGEVILNPPMVGLNGSLQSAALEQSNVDLSTELVRLIEGQRNYQANSKTLETVNTITQTILQI